MLTSKAFTIVKRSKCRDCSDHEIICEITSRRRKERIIAKTREYSDRTFCDMKRLGVIIERHFPTRGSD